MDCGTSFDREPLTARPHGATLAAGATVPAQRKSVDAFVGRKQELAWLKDAVRSARSQRGRVCLLAGEAGIGKTRLAAEFAAFAEDHGMRVLAGYCHEEAGSPPYWPWARALGQLSTSLPARA